MVKPLLQGLQKIRALVTVVQVEGDRVGEQSSFFVITPINLTHESSPVLSHQQHQLAAFDKVLPSLQEQHNHKRNTSALQT